MVTTTITSKGQATIPKSIRQMLGLKAPGKIMFEIRGGDVLLRATGSPAGLLSSYAKRKPGRTVRQSVGRYLATLDAKARAH
jgi:AbrB family looped-hinge helix DNA binding protein